MFSLLISIIYPALTVASTWCIAILAPVTGVADMSPRKRPAAVGVTTLWLAALLGVVLSIVPTIYLFSDISRKAVATVWSPETFPTVRHYLLDRWETYVPAGYLLSLALVVRSTRRDSAMPVMQACCATSAFFITWCLSYSIRADLSVDSRVM